MNSVYEHCEPKPVEPGCEFDCQMHTKCDVVKEPWPAYHISHSVFYKYQKSFYTAVVHNYDKTLDMKKYPRLGIFV